MTRKQACRLIGNRTNRNGYNMKRAAMSPGSSALAGSESSLLALYSNVQLVMKTRTLLFLGCEAECSVVRLGRPQRIGG